MNMLCTPCGLQCAGTSHLKDGSHSAQPGIKAIGRATEQLQEVPPCPATMTCVDPAVQQQVSANDCVALVDDIKARPTLTIMAIFPTGHATNIGTVLVEELESLLTQVTTAQAYQACLQYLSNTMVRKYTGGSMGVLSVYRLSSKGKAEEWKCPSAAEMKHIETLAVILGTPDGRHIPVGGRRRTTCSWEARLLLAFCCHCNCTICTFFHFSYNPCIRLFPTLGDLELELLMESVQSALTTGEGKLIVE